ncbi:MAG: hypothetical protein HYX54_02045 [Chloroflexi bacterium]|nr:hypothetical protein [Chloroflexota bacterium]
MDAKLRGGPAWRGGALGGVLIAAVAIIAAVALTGGQPAGASASAVPSAAAATDPVVPSAVPSVEPSVALSVPVLPLRPAISPLGYGLDGSGWFQLDSTGATSITGYRLTAGKLGWVGSFTVDLPNPAFAAGPFGDRILYGGDDGNTSEVAALSLVDGTRRVLLTSDQPVWRATLDRDATNLYYVLLDRTTRADLGIWRLRLDGSSKAEMVMTAPAWVAEIQPATGTEFVWGPAGDVLAVYSCGLGVGCRTRVLDVATGKVRSYDEVPLHGGVIGMTASEYIASENCPGLPCPLFRVDLATGRTTTLVGEAGAGDAVFVRAAAGPLLVYQAPFVSDYRLLGLNLTTGITQQIYSGPTDGPTLVRFLGYRSVDLPTDWLVLGPQGELLPLPGALGAPIALRLDDNAQVPLTGVSK